MQLENLLVPVRAHRVDTFANTNHPQVMLWFVDPSTFEGDQYLREIDHIAAEGSFDLVFLTFREGPPLFRDGALFYHHEKMRPIFRRLVARAAEKGIRVGLHFLPNEFQTPDEAASALAAETECELDAEGRAELTGIQGAKDLTAPALGASSRRPFRAELLRVYLFRKDGAGFYVPGSLVDATDKYVRDLVENPESVQLRIEASAEFAGYSVYILTGHYFRYGDPFDAFTFSSFGDILERYSDIPFSGMALDEYGYIYREAPWERTPESAPVRERNYGRAMAEFYQAQTGKEMIRGLFDMRYAPSGQPEVRIQATNQYFEIHRQGPLRVERFFHDAAKRIYGQSAFIGFHNTAHNLLTNDEIWRTGIGWWELPRDYGQTDENIPYPVRMGVACSAPKDLLYDMYYVHDIQAYCAKAVEDARYGGRIHYHAYNDGGWGHDLKDPAFLNAIRPIEEKMKLLNRFDPPLPEMEVLIVFGYPALCNWYPNEGARNVYDINGDLYIMEKASEVWAAGYVCALAPSNAIDTGQITVSPTGEPLYNGRRFRAMVYLYPEYAKESTISFLEKYAARGGSLMIEGSATRDFDGNDIRERFNALCAKADFTSFSVANLAAMGARANTVSDGCRCSDGSVVMTDLASIQTGHPKTFRAKIDGDVYEAECIGLAAISSTRSEGLRKLAAGGLKELRRNGKTVVTLSAPADLYLTRDGAKGWEAWIASADKEITVEVAAEL